MEKLVFALTLLLAAFAAGWFVSNYLILYLLGLHGASPVWNTWWLYLRAIDLPQVAAYVDKIKWCGEVSFGVPLLAWAGLLIPLFRRKPSRSIA